MFRPVLDPVQSQDKGQALKALTGTVPSRVPQSTRLLFSIDPGTTESGWVLLSYAPDGTDCKVVDSGVATNHDLLEWVKAGQGADRLAIEMIAGMGMTVGQTTFETIRWIGRFQQAWCEPERVRLVYRREVKTFLCGNQQAKDANIRQALIDLIGEPGVKRTPGPTYGVKSHAWAALGVAATVVQAKPHRQTQMFQSPRPKPAKPSPSDYLSA